MGEREFRLQVARIAGRVHEADGFNDRPADDETILAGLREQQKAAAANDEELRAELKLLWAVVDGFDDPTGHDSYHAAREALEKWRAPRG